MIKLKFSNLEITTNGTITRGKIIATIKLFTKNEWRTIISKKFNTKITLKPEDKFDLNKAYKYIQAKLEKEAYKWALKETKRQIRFARQDFETFTNFGVKAQYIINHDTEYLNKF